MAFRELFVVEIKEILRLWRRGRGFRAIARQTGVNRKTVHRYVDAAQALGMSQEEGSRPLDDELIAEVVTALRPGAPSVPGLMRSHCMTYADRIEKWVDQGCKGPKVVRLLTRHTGVPVPLRTMQRFIAEELNRGGRDSTVRIVDPPPGQILEVDFLELGWFVERGTGKRRKMHALLCTAGNSRHQFLYPALEQTQEIVIEALEEAWAFFGGVFAVLVPDNLKAIVLKADPVAPKLNPTFLEYAQARDFEIDPARKRKPKDKARVERQVRFARDDYFKGEDFGSVEEARLAAVRWCRDVAGMRVHGTTRRHPLEAFNEDELPLLKPAPTEPYDTPRWFTLHVGRDHAVTVNYALYSVPYQLGEGELRVRMDRATVKMYQGAKLVKVHPRQPRGGSNIEAADLPPGKAELATRDGESLQQQAELFGPSVGVYAERLLEGPLPWTRMRHAYRLLVLAKRFGGELVDEACACALELDVVNVTRVQGMLEKGLVRRGLLSSPRPPMPQGKVLRFAREPAEFRTDKSSGGSDAA